MPRWTFAKGHGTENDFILLPDPDGTRAPSDAEVRFLCDRRAGMGADGLLRVVRSAHLDRPAGAGGVGAGGPGTGGAEMGAEWFMDYRNADGSIAEMCGNGIRVFVRYLVDNDLAAGPDISVGTRDGVKVCTILPDGQVRVAMGPARVDGSKVTVRLGDGTAYVAQPADVGNPHAVSFVDDLSRLNLGLAPVWSPESAFRAGVNLEFVSRRGPGHIAMRVYERGSGETRSCGTGTVAAAAVSAELDTPSSTRPITYRVDVPGGTVWVELAEDQAYLTGPAVIVAYGEVLVPD